MKRIAVYAGSFDPVTFGHLDIVYQASMLFDELHVAVGINDQKKPMFDMQQRLDFLRHSLMEFVTHTDSLVGDTCEIKLAAFSGMLVDYARENEIGFIVRGLRDHIDFAYESHIAAINYQLSMDEFDEGGLRTVWLYASESVTHVSSSLVREMIKYKADFSRFSPIRLP